jgi:hypothetical protein
LAATFDDDGGNNQASLRHPPTVTDSPIPMSCDTLFRCPKTPHCRGHSAIKQIKADF